jgi:ABC-2 type transport system permease protein
VADWPTYLGVMAQAVAVGGPVLFALVTAWVFGREFADRTVKLTLALPTPRASIVAAKFLVAAAWSALLSAWVFLLSLGIGRLVGMPGWSGRVASVGAVNLAAAAGLAIALLTPMAFLACAGRGYLAPIGFAMLMLFLAQIFAATGWGAWFPWSVPPLFAGLAGPRGELLGGLSYVLVAATSAVGMIATFVWWELADQTT